jgi:hypothetical protein
MHCFSLPKLFFNLISLAIQGQFEHGVQLLKFEPYFLRHLEHGSWLELSLIGII